MKYLVTGKEMKLLDEGTSARFNIPSEVLMEQAADAFIQELFLITDEVKSAVVLCGAGNNAGDGIVIARILNQRGIRCSLYLCSSTESGLYKKQLDTYRMFEFPIVSSLDDVNECDLIIDGLLGTGLSRNVEGAYKSAIEWANEKKALRVSIDIPSGISSDDGRILGVAFKADYTITFSFEKIGHYLYPGAEYTGDLRLKQIEITESSIGDSKPRVLRAEDEDVILELPKHIAYSNKGTYGKLLIIAGSKDMAGAAYFAAKAAYRSGCGLVKIVTAEENRIVLQQMIPEAILSTYDKSISEEQLCRELKWATAVLIGPGLGTDKLSKELVKLTLRNVTVPLLIDADGLNIISENVDQLLKPHFDIVVTPHIGEMARLIGEANSYVSSHLIEVASEFADKYNVVCHLKDARSVTAIPYGNRIIQTKGNYGMATAGSGDVLSGIVASLMAQGMNYEKAAYIGARVHGDAGDEAAKTVGRTSMMASDLIDALSRLAYFR